MPSQVDTRPFAVGRNIATTPGHVVHRTDVFELIQYDETTKQVHERPLVVIPPQINKYYITDLAPGRSLVESTVAAGFPYFTLSWRNPTPEQRDWNLDTYAAACLEAIQVACDIAGSDDANVVGVCAGGVTLAALLGHLAATGEVRLVQLGDVPRHRARHRDRDRRSPRSHLGVPSRPRGRDRCAPVCSPVTTWPRSSRGCDRTTSCGTTG